MSRSCFLLYVIISPACSPVMCVGLVDPLTKTGCTFSLKRGVEVDDTGHLKDSNMVVSGRLNYVHNVD